MDEVIGFVADGTISQADAQRIVALPSLSDLVSVFDDDGCYSGPSTETLAVYRLVKIAGLSCSQAAKVLCANVKTIRRHVQDSTLYFAKVPA